MLSVVLISCGKAKVNYPAPARDLYVGSLFVAARRYAEATGLPWFIISAKHGLLNPLDVVEPYEVPLSSKTLEMRQCWAGQVIGQLVHALPEIGWTPGRGNFPGLPGHNGTPTGIEVHACMNYADVLTEHKTTRHSWKWATPLAGLQLGERLRWYRQDKEARDAREAAMRQTSLSFNKP